MLTSTKPRSSPPRPIRTPNPPPISYSTPTPRPSSQSTITTPSSPPTSQHRGRRPSISNTMHWLSRSSTQSTPYAPSKPTRISEPKLVRSIELMSQARSGVLGSGATVVRTPDEALRETGVRLTFDGKAKDEQASLKVESARNSQASDKLVHTTQLSSESYPSPQSPPLPPLPMPEFEESQFFSGESAEVAKAPPRPTRAPPPPPAPSLRPSLKVKRVSTTEDTLPIPPLPANIPTLSPPLFNPILVSDVPTGVVDPSKIIVVLETCTSTFKTTLNTLTSRSSHLSAYVSSLVSQKQRESGSSSVYSSNSDDMSMYRRHLISQGLLPQTFSIHIFLDRPSAPYVHILNYLRASLSTPEAIEILPRGTQLQSSSHQRLESLLDLRDEAAYLGLDGLHKLCIDELRLRHGPRLHARGHSTSTGGSAQSMHASVYSLHTLLERVESDMRSENHDSDASDSKAGKDSSNEMGSMKSPPTPLSWTGPLRERSQGRHSPSRSPPAGWI
ncbi:hypothetical protein BDZ94DRAFT_1256587 [Collybia nuda]|uniref:Uncharacterized protein n=1 Tax=Collybia nuda TaxID=64659 RepID=A0A9P6CL38_9AGAR|nr:hypothetical protein BDZ94DRAFT_1256587 [Collybia nuda]